MAEEFTPSFIFTSVLTLTICAFGLVGNFLCALVLFHKDMKSSSYVYLLQGLTFSDMGLLTLSTIRTLGNLNVIYLGNPTVQTITFFWDWICTSGTKWFTVAVSLERFFVVTYPLKAHQYCTLSRARKFALSIFIFVVLLSISSFVYLNYIDAKSYDIYTAIVLHFTPFILVVIFNVFIFIGLRKLQKLRKTLTEGEAKEESITKMLFTVVLVFGICYTFEFIRRVMNYGWKDYMNAHKYYDYTINHLADIFYVLNSSVNFLIYCLLGQSFRKVFLKILGSLPCGKVVTVCRRKCGCMDGDNKDLGLASSSEASVTASSKVSSSVEVSCP